MYNSLVFLPSGEKRMYRANSRWRILSYGSQMILALTLKMPPIMTLAVALTVGLTVGLTASCIPKPTEGILLNAPPGTLQSATKPRIVFNWSSGSGPLNQHLWDQVRDAMSKNREIKTQGELPKLGQQGYGLYVTMDPFVSLSFGSELSCLSLNPRTTWVGNDLAEEASLANIRGPSDLLVYGWGTSFLDGVRKTAISGVIRNPRLVDMNPSAKIIMKEFGSGDGLGAMKIAKARQRLQTGNWCQAFSAFENEFGTFSMAFSSAFSFGDSKGIYRNVLAANWLMLPGAGMNPVMERAIDMVEKNVSFISELKEAGILKGNKTEERKLEIKSVLSRAFNYPPGLIAGDVPAEQIPARMALLARLLNETGIFKLSGNSNSLESFTAAFNEASYQFISQWGQDHPQDVALAKDLIAILLKNGLTGMAKQLPWPE